MHDLLKSVHVTARGLVRNPGVSATAVIALSLGIGLTTVMFSIVYGALHRGLPFEGADRIMHLERANLPAGNESMEVTIHDFVDWRARQRSFESLAAYYEGTVNIRGTESPIRYDGGFMSEGSFEVVGVDPILGRDFTAEDMRPGAPIVVLLGYETWQEDFAGDRGVLERSYTINGQPGRIIGVMPEGFEFPELQEVWTPIRLDPVALPRGTGTTLEVFGKLREGVDIDRAMVDLTAVAAQLAEEHPETNEGVTPLIKPFTEEFIGDEERGVLYAMLATVILVLLIACANVASLLLARAAARTRDTAIQTAMGASRLRVVTELLVEAVVLALAGAVLGTGIAWVGITLFDQAVQPTDPPFWLEFKLDAPILAFVIAITGVAALASGVIPAFRASATDVSSVLKDESRGSSGLHIGRVTRVLVVGEVAMSVALLVASGLMIKSVLKLNALDYGFPTEDVFTARVGIFAERFPDPASRYRFWDDLEERLDALPGVRSAALVSHLPGTASNGSIVQIEGERYETSQDIPFARWAVVTPRFFETFDVEVLQGRPFTPLDVADAAPVAIVNRSFARLHFPNGGAVGRRFRTGGLQSESDWREIVGVVPDLYLDQIGDTEASDPQGFYIPLSQSDARFLSIAARTRGDPLTITTSVRDQVTTADPDTPIYWVRTHQAAIDENLWFYSVFGTLFAVFGLAALFMASVGLYGVMSFSVSRRIQEMGIRMALGARSRRVLSLVLSQGLGQIVIGLVLGTGLAVVVATSLSLLIFESEPWDPVTYALVFAALATTGFVATLLPALRATRVDPVVALRYE